MEPTASSRPMAATRRDASGTDETALLLDAGDNIFAVLHQPAAMTSRWSVVVCPPLGNELIKHYRREVLLARALAGAGSAVIRFQYRGTGNSGGDPSATSRATMLADTAAAVEALLERAPGTTPLFVGSRFGALVAAGCSAVHGDAPLLLIEPVLSADAYFKEVLRAKAVQGIAGGGADVARLRQELEHTGSAELLGQVLHRTLHDSWTGRSIVSELGIASPPVLLVSFSGRGRPAAAHRVHDALSATGCLVTAAAVEAPDESWWYLDERELLEIGREPSQPATSPPAMRMLIDSVLSWVAALEDTRG